LVVQPVASRYTDCASRRNVIQKKVGSERENAMRGWKELHNEELNHLHVLVTR
jgi:hypothetical protein